TTSTSGSSGTGRAVVAGAVGPGHRDAQRGGRAVGEGGVRYRAVRRLGGLLLVLLLGAADAVAVEPVGHLDLRGERLHVVGAGGLDDVLGDAEGVLGGELLQGGFPVQAGAEASGGLHQRVEEQVYDRASRLEARG